MLTKKNWLIFAAITGIAIACTPLKAQVSGTLSTSWVGNTFGGANFVHVQDNMESIFVRSDGTVFTCGVWDEGGHVNSYWKNGQLQSQYHLYNDSGSDSVVNTGSYSYLANCYGSGGIYKYNTDDGNILPIKTFGSGLVEGLALYNNQLYAAENDKNQIEIFNLSDESSAGSFSVNDPSRIAVDNSGEVWVTHKSGFFTQCSGTVDCYNSSGSHVRSITLPDNGQADAICVDNQGRLLIGDIGPDQNIKIYTNITSSPTLSTTLGVAGGQTAGPTAGYAGAQRFLGITGVGSDSSGNIYVSENGIGASYDEPANLGSGDIGDGVSLSCYNSSFQLQWVVHGLDFLDNAGMDPGSESDVYDAAHHYQINWNNLTPGTEWSLIGTTFNPLKYPNDPRNTQQNLQQTGWIQRIQGKKFLYTSDQAGGPLTMYRFNSSTDGDIAIPCAMIDYGAWQGHQDMANQPTSGECIWYDANGDGNMQASEYTQPSGAQHIDGQYFYVDSNGNIWQARGEPSPKTIAKWSFQGFDSHGTPLYDYNHLSFETAPGDISQIDACIYIVSTDTMYLLGDSKTHVVAYPHWSTGNRTSSWVVTLPYTQDQIQPAGMSVAGNYVFVTYWQPHQILVYNTSNGSSAGTILAGDSVGGPVNVGNVDMPMCINAYQRSNGEYAIFNEEDFQNKVLMYRWNPNGGLSGGGGGSAPSAPTLSTPIAGNGQVSLSWSAPSGATSYQVSYGTSSGSYNKTLATQTSTTATVSSLTNGTTYYFVVTASNSYGTSSPSNEKSAVPTSGTTGGAPVITASSYSVTPNPVAPSASVTYSITFKNTGGALSNGQLGIRILNSSSTKVDQKTVSGVNLAAGASQTVTYTSKAPSTTGTYSLLGGAWSTGETTTYLYHNVQTFTVSSSSGTKTTKYEAESGTLTGTAQIFTDSARSGGAIVGHIIPVGADTLNNVNGGAGGSCSLVINYSSNSNARSSLYVNGTFIQKINWANGTYGTWRNQAAITITLKAGTTNSIEISSDSDDAAYANADLDYITVTTP